MRIHSNSQRANFPVGHTQIVKQCVQDGVANPEIYILYTLYVFVYSSKQGTAIIFSLSVLLRLLCKHFEADHHVFLPKHVLAMFRVCRDWSGDMHAGRWA